MRVAAVNGLTPDDYYLAALARHQGGPEILRYLPFDLIRATAHHLSGSLFETVTDKLRFEHTCRAAGLRVVNTIAIANERGVLDPSGHHCERSLPDLDLIIKPVSGEQGRGIEMWRNVRPGLFCDADDKTISSDHLIRRMSSLAGEHGSIMFAQERIENHPDLQPMAGTALATTRIVTMIDETGEPEIVESFYRTSVSPGAAVDNFHAGGLLFPIDPTTGILRPGFSDGPYNADAVTRHPITGTDMVGTVHPCWRPMVELALRLHRIYPDLIMPGWDIGFGHDGPIVIEGNNCSAISLNRQSTFDGVVGTRALALMTYHSDKWLELNEPVGSRRRFAKIGKPV